MRVLRRRVAFVTPFISETLRTLPEDELPIADLRSVRRFGGSARFALCLAACLGIGSTAKADEAAAAATPSGVAADPFGLLPQGPNLFGDLGGLRPLLDKNGVTLSVIENSEVFGNGAGGVGQRVRVQRPDHGNRTV